MVRIALLLALIAVSAMAGVIFNFAPLFLVLPLGALILAAILVPELRRRRAPAGEEEPERSRLGAKRLEFTERDRRTLTP